MKHFCIIANKEKDPQGRFAKHLADCFRENGCRAYVIAPLVPGADYGEVQLEEGTDLAVILGGDGTFLRAAKVLRGAMYWEADDDDDALTLSRTIWNHLKEQ